MEIMLLAVIILKGMLIAVVMLNAKQSKAMLNAKVILFINN